MKKRYLLGALLCLTMMGCNQLEPVTSTTPNTSHTSTSKGTSSASTSQDDTALKTAKEAAKEYLQGIVDNADVEDKSQLNSKLISIFNNIEKCKTVEDVESVKTKGASSLNELIEILTVSEGTREVKENAIAELNTIKNDKANDSRYDEDGIAEINEYINTALTTINSATSNEAIEATLESAKAAINAVKTKNANFYSKMTCKSDDGAVDYSSSFSFADEKITNNNKSGFTQFRIGERDGYTSAIADFYITIDYANTQYSNIALYFRSWDTNTSLKILFTDAGMTEYGKVDYNKGPTTIEPIKNVGLKDKQKYHIEILTCGWTKVVRVNNEIVWRYDNTEENQDFMCGTVQITTWQTAYTLEDTYYKDTTDDWFKTSSYYAKLWN